MAVQGPLSAIPPTPLQRGGGPREEEKQQHHCTEPCHVLPSSAESWGFYSVSLADGSLPTWSGYPQRPNPAVSSVVKSPHVSLSFSLMHAHTPTSCLQMVLAIQPPSEKASIPFILQGFLLLFPSVLLPAWAGPSRCELHDSSDATWRLALQLLPTFTNGLTVSQLCPLCCILGARLLSHPRIDGFGLSLPTHCPAYALPAPRETSILFPTCYHRGPLGSYSTVAQARV